MSELGRSVDSFVLGTWGLTGDASYNSPGEAACFRIFEAAHQAGIRRIDTASSYGDRGAWQRLRNWRREFGQAFSVTLKIGRPLIEGVPTERLSDSDLRDELGAGIEMLGRPDLVLVKDPPSDWIETRSTEALETLRRACPGAAVGIASHRLDACAGLRRTEGDRVAQVEYHGVNWPLAAGVARGLREKGWAVSAMQPLLYGFLARDAPREFAPADWRSKLSRELAQQLSEGADRFHEAFRGIAAGHAKATVSIAFLLADPHVSTVVIGPKSLKHLEEALRALDLLEDVLFLERCTELRQGVPRCAS